MSFAAVADTRQGLGSWTYSTTEASRLLSLFSSIKRRPPIWSQRTYSVPGCAKRSRIARLLVSLTRFLHSGVRLLCTRGKLKSRERPRSPNSATAKLTFSLQPIWPVEVSMYPMFPWSSTSRWQTQLKLMFIASVRRRICNRSNGF